ncbi:MAG: carbon-nitrogen family hydrolase [Nitrospirae bacterium]|nr:carbon-nitrogen family hydrolase [Nitrospirota bacterium]
MKIALIQLNIAWESKRANFDKAELFVKKASHEKCDIVVFPEMFNTGFSMNVSAVAEDKDGETAAILSNMAQKNNINIIAGYSLKDVDNGKGNNIAAAYDRKGLLIASYTKIHPFSFAKEDQYYSAGNTTVIFDIEGMKASIFICYDLRFPEVFRNVAKEVQTIFVIANWPSSRREHWETLLKARAIENQCFVIGVNRTGKDGNDIQYPGSSFVFDPLGKEICSGNDVDELIICNINIHEVSEIRARFPFLKDMRRWK